MQKNPLLLLEIIFWLFVNLLHAWKFREMALALCWKIHSGVYCSHSLCNDIVWWYFRCKLLIIVVMMGIFGWPTGLRAKTSLKTRFSGTLGWISRPNARRIKIKVWCVTSEHYYATVFLELLPIGMECKVDFLAKWSLRSTSWIWTKNWIQIGPGKVCPIRLRFIE